MNDALLNDEVIIYLLSEIIIYLLLFIAFLATPTIIKNWNFNNFSSKQFKLENRSYLVITIISFTIILKIMLIPYLIYTIDELSNIVAGAMCGAGVIKANAYGNPLLFLKIIVIFLSGFWITINQIDLKSKNYKYTILKLWLFVAIFFLMTMEITLDILYFTNIETSKPVSCCSVIFDNRDYLFMGLDVTKIVILFYLLYMLIVLTTLSKKYAISMLANILFLPIAYYSVVYFFGTYIYQLPTHKCPFCMMQSDYYFVGYLLWGLLILGVFRGINQSIIEIFFAPHQNKKDYIALVLLTLFVLLCSGFVLFYYIERGVFL